MISKAQMQLQMQLRKTEWNSKEEKSKLMLHKLKAEEAVDMVVAEEEAVEDTAEAEEEEEGEEEEAVDTEVDMEETDTKLENENQFVQRN